MTILPFSSSPFRLTFVPNLSASLSCALSISPLMRVLVLSLRLGTSSLSSSCSLLTRISVSRTESLLFTINSASSTAFASSLRPASALACPALNAPLLTSDWTFSGSDSRRSAFAIAGLLLPSLDAISSCVSSYSVISSRMAAASSIGFKSTL